MSEQPTIEWHYLPELPPSPVEGDIMRRYLITISEPYGDETLHIVLDGWYDDSGRWIGGPGYELIGVYAWAAWPEAPPVRGEAGSS